MLGLQAERIAEFDALPAEQAEAAVRKDYPDGLKFHPDKTPTPQRARSSSACSGRTSWSPPSLARTVGPIRTM